MHKKIKLQVACLITLTAFSFFAYSQTDNTLAQTYSSEQESLLKQINELLVIVENLQKQLQTITGGSNTGEFYRNLKVGDFGEDVRLLQKILNQNPSTYIASTGPGSPKNETDFFGELTKNAVIKFQNLYKKDILEPVGLSFGTGFVGESTRNKLSLLKNSTTNNVVESSSTDNIIKENIENIQGGIDEMLNTETFHYYENIDLFYPETYEVRRGQTLSILGAGFSLLNNTVLIDDKKIEGVPSPSGTKITFVVPTDLSYGMHDVYVESGNKKSTNTIFIIIIEEGAIKPRLSGVANDTLKYGDMVTVYGENFSLNSNDIYTSYGIIKNIPAIDKNTLTFQFLPLPEVPELQIGVDLGLHQTVPFTFYVGNTAGMSEEFSTIYLSL